MLLWIFAHIFLCTYVVNFLGYIPWSGTDGSFGNCLTSWMTVFQSGCPFLCSTNNVWVFGFLYILTNTWYFLIWAILGGMRRQWHPTPAWKTPWTEEPGGLQSMGSRRVGHDWVNSLSLVSFMHWRRKWQPTPVFLPGESQGRGSLVGCRLWGRRVGHDWSDLAVVVVSLEAHDFRSSIKCILFFLLFMLLVLYLKSYLT